MALIDVTNLLSDPDFSDTATLIKRTSSVDSFGRNALIEAEETITCVVQGLGNDDLAKLPTYAASLENIVVHYKGALYCADGAGTYSDIIRWRDKRYEVTAILENLINYGGGWTKAAATLEAPND